ncbi:MAG TPA: hypothetical protein VGE07_23825, partial [Herpetosiphonaceae bacterium]
MAAPILSTKLYLPPPRPGLIDRPRLSERLSAGLRRPLTLITAPAGFGKTTLLAAWLADQSGDPLGGRAAWLALDEADSDPGRFLAYLIAAARSLAPGSGAGALGALQSTQPPPPEAIVAALINDLAALPGPFALVLDDYHLIDSPQIDAALALLIDRMPPQMRLVIAARDVPRLPLARLRARGQLTELRAGDLRFTADEAAAFLNQAMGLGLAPAQVEALERRTEGWIAGLQLAAISLRGQRDAAAVIGSFAGGHRFVLDYLAEEVLARQPAPIQRFLLRTSILGRLCGPLCDALAGGEPPGAEDAAQTTLEYLDRANLFITPLDDERRWYRYHHLFAEALLQRLRATAPADEAALRLRASAWLEANGFELEAFQQAAAAGAIDRAALLGMGGPMPLIFRGAAAPILAWLEGLPAPALAARPALLVT